MALPDWDCKRVPAGDPVTWPGSRSGTPNHAEIGSSKGMTTNKKIKIKSSNVFIFASPVVFNRVEKYRHAVILIYNSSKGMTTNLF